MQLRDSPTSADRHETVEIGLDTTTTTRQEAQSGRRITTDHFEHPTAQQHLETLGKVLGRREAEWSGTSIIYTTAGTII